MPNITKIGVEVLAHLIAAGIAAWGTRHYEANLQPVVEAHPWLPGVAGSAAVMASASYYAWKYHQKKLQELKNEADTEWKTLGAKIAQLERELDECRKGERDRFIARTNVHHDLAHAIRNLLVHLVSGLPLRRGKTTPSVPQAAQGELDNVMKAAMAMFGDRLKPHVGVSAFLMARHAENYITVASASNGRNGLPAKRRDCLHRNCPSFQAVRRGYEEKECVTHIGERLHAWSVFSGDWRPTDKRLLISAIVSKKIGPKGLKSEVLEWVFVISVDDADADTEQLIGLMRTVGDELGTDLNVLMRTSPAKGNGEIRRFDDDDGSQLAS